MGGSERKPNLAKPFAELQVGDSTSDRFSFCWQFVAPIPEEVAEYWIVEFFPQAAITKEGYTSIESAMKTWEPGIGIVVAAPTAIPGEKRLCLLRKVDKNTFGLYLSRETRETSQAEP